MPEEPPSEGVQSAALGWTPGSPNEAMGTLSHPPAMGSPCGAVRALGAGLNDRGAAGLCSRALLRPVRAVAEGWKLGLPPSLLSLSTLAEDLELVLTHT